MSDPITVLAGLQYNLGDTVRQSLNASFIVDYGIVTAVNEDGTVDVVHAVQGQYINGEAMAKTNTRYIEVIFPGSAGMAITWPIAVGDGVLLLGLKNFIPTTTDIEAPVAPPNEFPHYNQDTLKAIPLQNISAPSFTIAVDEDSLGQIKNTAKSLFTILDNVDASIQTFSSATSQSALTAGAATSASLAAALNLLLNAMNVSITTAKSDLALLLKA